MATTTTKPKTKFWTEIKLRDPEPRICAQIELLVQDFRQVSASKALQSYILDYSARKAATADLRSVNMRLQAELEAKEEEIQIYKEKLQRITKYYDLFREEVATGVNLVDKKPQIILRG